MKKKILCDNRKKKETDALFWIRKKKLVSLLRRKRNSLLRLEHKICKRVFKKRRIVQAQN